MRPVAQRDSAMGCVHAVSRWSNDARRDFYGSRKALGILGNGWRQKALPVMRFATLFYNAAFVGESIGRYPYRANFFSAARCHNNVSTVWVNGAVFRTECRCTMVRGTSVTSSATRACAIGPRRGFVGHRSRTSGLKRPFRFGRIVRPQALSWGAKWRVVHRSRPQRYCLNFPRAEQQAFRASRAFASCELWTLGGLQLGSGAAFSFAGWLLGFCANAKQAVAFAGKDTPAQIIGQWRAYSDMSWYGFLALVGLGAVLFGISAMNVWGIIKDTNHV
jgi:hypothetical protein